MKKAYSTILFLLLISISQVAQTGTIKIAKPAAPPTAKKDTIIPKKKYIAIGFEAGSNYTFKSINQFGYYAELHLPTHHPLFFGIGYDHENEYYRLSPYSTETLKPALAYSKSENKSNYVKLQLGVSSHLSIGNSSHCYFLLALEPQYLLQTKNQHDRLTASNFNKFNLAGLISIGIPIKNRFSLNIRYSKDFIDNLKDKSIYNETGTVVGKQKSKTNLLSISLSANLVIPRK
ncbi:hypothetical protein BH10BAC1_BH10BAC1_17930 [soil metagenome]